MNSVLGFGNRGLWLLGLLIFVLRPCAIFISLRRTPLQIKEKLFLSFLAPRGIVAASTASLFALIFTGEGYADAAPLESLVYLVIGTTVILEGLPAGLIARLLRVTEEARNGVLIVGAHKLGREIAHSLQQADIEVKLVDTNFWHFRAALQEGLEAYHGNALKAGFLQDIQTRRIGQVLAITANAEINILVSQLAHKQFGEGSAIQLGSRQTHETKEISEELGGKMVFPKLPYLEELEPGLEEGQYEWREVTVPKGAINDGPINVAGGRFWPLMAAKMPPVHFYEAGHNFKSEEQVFGIYRADARV